MCFYFATLYVPKMLSRVTSVLRYNVNQRPTVYLIRGYVMLFVPIQPYIFISPLSKQLL